MDTTGTIEPANVGVNLPAPTARRRGASLLPRAFLFTVACAISIMAGVASPARAYDPSLSGIRIMYRTDDIVVTVSTHISRLLRAEGQGSLAMTPVEMDLAVRRRLSLRFDARFRQPGMRILFATMPTTSSHGKR